MNGKTEQMLQQLTKLDPPELEVLMNAPMRGECLHLRRVTDGSYHRVDMEVRLCPGDLCVQGCLLQVYRGAKGWGALNLSAAPGSLLTTLVCYLVNPGFFEALWDQYGGCLVYTPLYPSEPGGHARTQS